MKKPIVLALLFLISCGRKVEVRAPVPPTPGPPEHELLYREGLNAFRLATPEGYLRASDAFRRASRLNSANCDYSVHLAESLVFLAAEQRLNTEEFEPRLTEAGAILDASRTVPACGPFEGALDRISGMHLYLREPIRRNEGVAMVNKAIDLDPNDPLNWIVLSKLTSRDARNPVQRAVDLEPDLPLVQYEYGNFWLYSPNGLEKAREAFNRALDSSPRHFEAIVGKVYSFSGDEYSDETEPLLKQVVAIAPSFLTGRRLLGDYYSAMEETEKAIEQFRAAIATNPKYYPAFLSLGRTLLSAERLDEAAQAFRDLIQLDVTTPKPPYNATDYAADCQAHYFLGNIWFERGDFVTAREEYQRALNDIPTYPDALYSMGLVLQREGKSDEALLKFNQVINDNPNDFAGAYIARAAIRLNRRQFADAVADYNRAIDIFQRQLSTVSAKADMDQSKGRLKRAESGRRQKARLEAELRSAIDSKAASEAQLAQQ
jgi:tetratricopeptide (TPR) repeat protein